MMYGSGETLGEISDMLIDAESGEITQLEIDVDSGDGSPSYVPSEAVKWEDPEFVLQDGTDLADSPGKGDFVYGSGLLKSEVFAKPTWRIGLLTDLKVDPNSWRLDELIIDAHPEYIMSTELHSKLMPLGYPPNFQIALPASWADFHLSEEAPKKSSHLVLKMRGDDLESSAADRLKERGFEETKSDEDSSFDESRKEKMIGAIRTAFEDAHRLHEER
jgi:hypothetical protein